MSKTYPLSYTAAGLRRDETVTLAQAFSRSGDWDEVRRQAVEDDLLMLRQVSSRRRVAGELVRRLKNLTPAECAFLADGPESASADAVIWLAICRTYPFIASFTTEVVGERWHDGVTTLNDGVYEAFVAEQAALHAELAQLKEQTGARLRSQLFTMLRAMGFLSQDGSLLPYLIPSEVAALLSDDDLAFFPTAVR